MRLRSRALLLFFFCLTGVACGEDAEEAALRARCKDARQRIDDKKRECEYEVFEKDEEAEKKLGCDAEAARQFEALADCYEQTTCAGLRAKDPVEGEKFIECSRAIEID